MGFSLRSPKRPKSKAAAARRRPVDFRVTHLEQRRVLSVTAVEAGTDQTVDEGELVHVSAMFEDADPNNGQQVEIDWGDGSTTSGSITEPVQGDGTHRIAGSHAYADNGDYTVTITVLGDDESSGSDSFDVTVDNVAPELLTLDVTPAIDESGSVTLTGTVSDPGTADTLLVVVDWGAGEISETFTLDAGAREFSFTHQYLDDNPSGTTTDNYNVEVTLLDDDAGIDTGSATTTVQNVAPTNLSLDVTPLIDENGTVTLSGTFEDAGTRDTYTVVVDWGAGEISETFTLDAGAREFSFTHQYLDDNPSGTAKDNYTISVTLVDDDAGIATGQAVTMVQNVEPGNLAIEVTPEIFENGVVTLTGSFDDPGSLDTHQVIVDWGAGEISETFTLDAGARDFVFTHQYLDDTPTGTPADFFTITVTIVDDDMSGEAPGEEADDPGEVADDSEADQDPVLAAVEAAGEEGGIPPATNTAAAVALVRNVAPTMTLAGNFFIELLDPSIGPAMLASFMDVGTLDTHSARINWGDGTPIDVAGIVQGAGMGTIRGSHTFAAPGNFAVTISLVDDDLGLARATFTVSVLPPAILDLEAPGFPETDRASLAAAVDEVPLFEPGNPRDVREDFFGLSRFNEGAEGGEIPFASEKRYVIRVVEPDGQEQRGIPLREEFLDDLPHLWMLLPDNRYRIYQIQENGTERLMYDVTLLNGETVNPAGTDDTLQRPPTEQKRDRDDSVLRRPPQDRWLSAEHETVAPRQRTLAAPSEAQRDDTPPPTDRGNHPPSTDAAAQQVPQKSEYLDNETFAPVDSTPSLADSAAIEPPPPPAPSAAGGWPALMIAASVIKARRRPEQIDQAVSRFSASPAARLKRRLRHLLP